MWPNGFRDLHEEQRPLIDTEDHDFRKRLSYLNSESLYVSIIFFFVYYKNILNLLKNYLYLSSHYFIATYYFSINSCSFIWSPFLEKKKPRTPKPRKAKEEDSYSDEDGVLIPLGSLTKPQRPPPITFQCLEIDIQPGMSVSALFICLLNHRLLKVLIFIGETLTSISLKYNIPISELKRVNNFLTGNEFFAMKRIKIPVKLFLFANELIWAQN